MPRKKPAVPAFQPKLVQRKRKPVALPDVRMNLGVAHQVNGVRYGPGVTLVPGALVPMIRETEQRSAAEERKLRDPRAVVITARNRTTRVDPSFFDNPEGWGSVPPAITA